MPVRGGKVCCTNLTCVLYSYEPGKYKEDDGHAERGDIPWAGAFDPSWYRRNEIPEVLRAIRSGFPETLFYGGLQKGDEQYNEPSWMTIGDHPVMHMNGQSHNESALFNVDDSQYEDVWKLARAVIASWNSIEPLLIENERLSQENERLRSIAPQSMIDLSKDVRSISRSIDVLNERLISILDYDQKSEPNCNNATLGSLGELFSNDHSGTDMKPHKHAMASARKYGGKWQDYEEIHEFFDHSKSAHPDVRHRALLHSAWGIYLAERVFGRTFENSDGRIVAVRDVAEDHVFQDMGFIPTASKWLDAMDMRPWMGGPIKKRVYVAKGGPEHVD